MLMLDDMFKIMLELLWVMMFRQQSSMLMILLILDALILIEGKLLRLLLVQTMACLADRHCRLTIIMISIKHSQRLLGFVIILLRARILQQQLL